MCVCNVFVCMDMGFIVGLFVRVWVCLFVCMWHIYMWGFSLGSVCGLYVCVGCEKGMVVCVYVCVVWGTNFRLTIMFITKNFNSLKNHSKNLPLTEE